MNTKKVNNKNADPFSVDNKRAVRGRISAKTRGHHIRRGFVLSAVMLFITFTAIMFSGLTIKQYMINISDQGKSSLLFTNETDKKEILKQANIDVSKHDRVTLSEFDEDNSANLTIERSFSIFVTHDGNSHSVNVIDQTVEDVLKQLKIKYDSNDIVTPDLKSTVQVGKDITVVEVETKVVTTRNPVLYKTKTTYTPSMPDGQKVVEVQGVNGEKEVKTCYVYHDGEIVSEEVVSEKVTKKPVSKQVTEGKTGSTASRLKVPSGLELDKNGNPVNYKAKLTGKATAYSSLGKPTKLVPGMIAMNLNDFPKGTKLYVKTPDGSYIYGYSEVRDTGTALYDGRTFVDLFFNSYQESVHFGAKTVDVYVLE